MFPLYLLVSLTVKQKLKLLNTSNVIHFCPSVSLLVTDVELKRLKDAFKRTSGLSYYMTQQCFYREVLGDGVPPKVAEVSHKKRSHALKRLV